MKANTASTSSSSVVTQRTVVQSSMSTRRTSNRRSQQRRTSKDEEAKENAFTIEGLNGKGKKEYLEDVLKEDYFERLPKTDYTYGDSGSYRRDRIGKPWRSPNLSRRGIHTSYTDIERNRLQTSVTNEFVESTEKLDSTMMRTLNSRTPASTRITRSVCLRTGGTGGFCIHKECSEASVHLQRRNFLESSSQNHIEAYNSNVNNSYQNQGRQGSSSSHPTGARRISLWRTVSDHTTSDSHGHDDASGPGGGGRRDNSEVSSIFGLDDASEETTTRVTRSRSKRNDSQRNLSNLTSETTTSSSNNFREHDHRQSAYDRANFSVFSRFCRFLCFGSTAVYCRWCYVRDSLYTLQERCGAPHPLLIPIFLLLVFLRYLVHLPCLLAHVLQSSGFMLLPRASSEVNIIRSDEDADDRFMRRRRGRPFVMCWPCFCIILLIAFLIFLIPFLMRPPVRPPVQPSDPGAEGKKDHANLAGSQETIGEWSRRIFVTITTPCKSAAYSICALGQKVVCIISNFFKAIVCFAMRVINTIVEFIVGLVRSRRVDTSEEEAIVTKEHASGKSSEHFTGKSSETFSAKYVEKLSRISDQKIEKIMSILREQGLRLDDHDRSLKSQSAQLKELLTSIAESQKGTDALKISVASVESDMKLVQGRTDRLEVSLQELEDWRASLVRSEDDRSSFFKKARDQEQVTSKELLSLKSIVERLENQVMSEGESMRGHLKQHEETLKNLAVANALASENKKAAAHASDATVMKLREELTAGHNRLATLEAQQASLKGIVDALRAKLAVKTQSQTQILPGKISLPDCGILKCNKNEDIRRLINEALDVFAADRIARPDFALESGGGSIVGTRCTQTYTDRPAVFSLFGVPLFRLSRSPRSVIQPAVQPGECWAFRGDKGQIVVRLSNPIVVHAITLEHIPTTLSPTGRIESAPREFEVRGLESESDYEGWSFGRFEYRADGPPLQTFNIALPTELDETARQRKQSRPLVFRYVELKILSNHGHPEYTCVYRMRVHGRFVEDNDSATT